ncbi:DNA alkylation repair enzyme [gut metagenome]|uniref:DNA alkylation repair enzyme n=1 Tax=gut metagenome TaxID=749906 RepID=J9GRB3_9ZZZZ
MKKHVMKKSVMKGSVMKGPAFSVIQQELENFVDPEKQRILPRFFKTGKGEYGEGDRFLGVAVPHIREVAKRHRDASLEDIDALLQSPWHECRFCALVLLVDRFTRASAAEERAALYAFYLARTDRINNWDLVDASAPRIVGGYLLDRSREDLYRLADSPWLWDQRIAVVANWYLIRYGQYTDLLALAEKLLHHPHDLMHKAIGWMLRELGKRDRDLLVQFLEKHRLEMPRTMLRYAIEKFSPEERRYFLGKA